MFICSNFGTLAESGDTDHLFQLGSPLGTKSSNDIGRLQNVPPFKIQTDSSKPFPRVNQYPTNKKALQGIKPMVEDHSLRASPLWYPCFICEKTQWLRMEVCPGVWARNKSVIPRHLCSRSCWRTFPVTQTSHWNWSVLCTCKIPVDKDSQHLSKCFPWEECKCAWTVMP